MLCIDSFGATIGLIAALSLPADSLSTYMPTEPYSASNRKPAELKHLRYDRAAFGANLYRAQKYLQPASLHSLRPWWSEHPPSTTGVAAHCKHFAANGFDKLIKPGLREEARCRTNRPVELFHQSLPCTRHRPLPRPLAGTGKCTSASSSGAWVRV